MMRKLKILLKILLLITYLAYSQVIVASQVGDPDGEISAYIPLKPNYEPNFEGSDFDLIKSYLVGNVGYPSDHNQLGSTSSKTFAKRCDTFKSNSRTTKQFY